MFLQEPQELLLKSHSFVMLLLILDVLNDVVQLRHAHTKRAIFFLPGELTMLRKRFMDPFGRTAFDELKCLGDGERGRQRKQDMHVIFNAADFDGFHFVLPRDAAQERPEPFAQRWREEGAAVFGTENAMEIRTDVGHAAHSAVPSGVVQSRTVPGVKTPGYSHDVPFGTKLRSFFSLLRR